MEYPITPWALTMTLLSPDAIQCLAAIDSSRVLAEAGPPLASSEVEIVPGWDEAIDRLLGKRFQYYLQECSNEVSALIADRSAKAFDPWNELVLEVRARLPRDLRDNLLARVQAKGSLSERVADEVFVMIELGCLEQHYAAFHQRSAGRRLLMWIASGHLPCDIHRSAVQRLYVY